MPAHLQTVVYCCCCKVSPLLPFQTHPEQAETRVYMETDGTWTLKPEFNVVPNIDAARCTGCGRCVAACPEKLITLEVSGYRKHAVIEHSEKCTLCGQCKLLCLVEAVAAS